MKTRYDLMGLVVLFNLSGNVHALPEVVDNSVYPPSAKPSSTTASSPSTDSLIEINTRLSQMQAEIQQLTGKIEEQADTINELKNQQKKIYLDLGDRVQQLEAKAGAGADVSSTVSSEATPASNSETPPPAANAPSTVPASPQPQSKPTEPNIPEAEKQDYQQAYLLLRGGHTDESITRFKNYLESYPSGALANNAQYWLGEAYLVKKDNNAARNAFNAVLEKYPNSNKEADALLMLGRLAMDEQHTEQARDYFSRVIDRFPNTIAARTATKKMQLISISQ